MLVVDGDVHITDTDKLPQWQLARRENGPNYFHGRTISGEKAVAQLDGIGVDMALVWQNPAATDYPGDPKGNFRAL